MGLTVANIQPHANCLSILCAVAFNVPFTAAKYHLNPLPGKLAKLARDAKEGDVSAASELATLGSSAAFPLNRLGDP